MNDYKLSEIQPNQLVPVKDILKQNNLPYKDLKKSDVYLMGAFSENELLGAAGLEVYNRLGIFRSLAIVDKYRSNGIGAKLHNAMIAYALVNGMTNLYLLTTTAEKYFEKYGWQKIDKNEVPEKIKKTSEFTMLCPDSAVCMILNLPKSKSDQAERIFKAGFNCSQSVFLPFAREQKMEVNQALKLATGFGAGMVYRGETCGAVTGAMMAIGLMYGRNIVSDEHARDKTYEIINSFYEKFRNLHGSIICKELLVTEISSQEGKIKAGKQGLFQNLCPVFVKSATEIAEELLK